MPVLIVHGGGLPHAVEGGAHGTSKPSFAVIGNDAVDGLTVGDEHARAGKESCDIGAGGCENTVKTSARNLYILYFSCQ